MMLVETPQIEQSAVELRKQKTIAILLEYRGIRYHGFQRQANALTIQEEMEKALEKLTGEKMRVKAASRTDAGVHALNQVVVFGTHSILPAETFIKGLNFYLPEDIAVKGARDVGEGFNPRREALSREYRYTILNSPTPSPLMRDSACWVATHLDEKAMAEAVRPLVGVHDFAPFSGPLGPPRSSTVRRMAKVEVERRGELVLFDIEASSFLPQQVRRMAGALVRVGMGKVSVEGFWALSSSRILGSAGPVLPPHGLCLMKVNYPESIFGNGCKNENL